MQNNGWANTYIFLLEAVMDKMKAALEKYVNAATDLAESVKRNICHESMIDDETVVKLFSPQRAASSFASSASKHAIESGTSVDGNDDVRVERMDCTDKASRDAISCASAAL